MSTEQPRVSARKATPGAGRLRVGLVGTGPWARGAWAPALAAHPGVEFVAVHGRRPVPRTSLAEDHGIVPVDSLSVLLEMVDAVAFSIPPAAQAELAVSAAAAGRHLLLEKPLALDAPAGDELEQAVADAGVASVVFHTLRFAPTFQRRLREIAGQGPIGLRTTWLADLDAPDNPFRDSAWRRERGALWDLGPHVLSVAEQLLGPIVQIDATLSGQLAHLHAAHAEGRRSDHVVSLQTRSGAAEVLRWWSPTGAGTAPLTEPRDVRPAFAAAISALVDAASGGAAPASDVAHGARLVRHLAQAEANAERLDGS